MDAQPPRHENAMPGGMGGDDAEEKGAAAALQPIAESSRMPARSAIADAVAARLEREKQQVQRDGSADEEQMRSAHNQKLRRIINDMSGAVSYDKAHACLHLVHTLANNIVTHPDEDKYRSFRATQPRIARDMLALDGAQDLLVCMGFRTRTRDFQQEWFVPDAATWKAPSSLGFKKLAWSTETIAARMAEYEDNATRTLLQREREAKTEASRKVRSQAGWDLNHLLNALQATHRRCRKFVRSSTVCLQANMQ